MGLKNPYRYRGYQYDTETGLYYLQSRYYNPEWGRFINADDTDVSKVQKGQLLGGNLFVYCNNNPVTHSDPSGYIIIPAYLLKSVVQSVVVWAFHKYFIERNRTWSWRKDGRDLLYAIVTGLIGGHTGKYFVNHRVMAKAYSIYHNIKFTVLSWTWSGGPPKKKRQLMWQIFYAIKF